MPLTHGATLGAWTLAIIVLTIIWLTVSRTRDSRIIPRQGVYDFLYGLFWLVAIIWLFM